MLVISHPKELPSGNLRYKDNASRYYGGYVATARKADYSQNHNTYLSSPNPQNLIKSSSQNIYNCKQFLFQDQKAMDAVVQKFNSTWEVEYSRRNLEIEFTGVKPTKQSGKCVFEELNYYVLN